MQLTLQHLDLKEKGCKTERKKNKKYMPGIHSAPGYIQGLSFLVGYNQNTPSFRSTLCNLFYHWWRHSPSYNMRWISNILLIRWTTKGSSLSQSFLWLKGSKTELIDLTEGRNEGINKWHSRNHSEGVSRTCLESQRCVCVQLVKNNTSKSTQTERSRCPGQGQWWSIIH